MPWPRRIKMFGNSDNLTPPPNPPRRGLVGRPAPDPRIQKRDFMQKAILAMLNDDYRQSIEQMVSAAEALYNEIEEKCK